MAIIVLHNNDSQGNRAPAAFGTITPHVFRIHFNGNRINPLSITTVRTQITTIPGPHIVIWVGHGDENQAHKGHPVTEKLPGQKSPLRINSNDLITLFSMCNPKRLYIFSCMGMRWVEREYNRFYRIMLHTPTTVKIYASSKRLLGGALSPVADAINGGQINPPGAFGHGNQFEETAIYGETHIEWRQRVAPQRSLSNRYHEAPF